MVRNTEAAQAAKNLLYARAAPAATVHGGMPMTARLAAPGQQPTAGSALHAPDLPPLLRALQSQAVARFGAQSVAVLQTHISWVLLAGDYAYKIKKPVKLPFLDFSALDLRKQYCQAELRLNQRYSPDIYLDVLAIHGTPEHPCWQGTGPVIEYAVRMSRFDDAARLDRVCDRGALTPEHLTDLARTVVAFHDAAAVARPGSGYGAPSTIREQAFENLDELAGTDPDAAMPHGLLRLSQWTGLQCSLLEPLMAQRQSQGLVRECHGDLHLANMVLLRQKVRLFDCIEFSEALRWIDVASDIAFTCVDLLAHQRPGLANWFVNEVLQWSGDYASAPLLRFYAVYRALVRAKIARLAAVPGAAGAIDYLALAGQLVRPQQPTLRITHGLSGCGKTFVTNALLQSDATANTLRLRTDVERKRLFHQGILQRTGSALNAGIYGADETEETYAHLRELAGDLLRAQWSVVVDGSFLQRARRDAFRDLAKECGVAFSIIAPQADADVLRQRISRRQHCQDDPSEATPEVLAHQMEVLEPLAADEPRWSGHAVSAAATPAAPPFDFSKGASP